VPLPFNDELAPHAPLKSGGAEAAEAFDDAYPDVCTLNVAKQALTVHAKLSASGTVEAAPPLSHTESTKTIASPHAVAIKMPPLATEEEMTDHTLAVPVMVAVPVKLIAQLQQSPTSVTTSTDKWLAPQAELAEQPPRPVALTAVLDEAVMDA